MLLARVFTELHQYDDAKSCIEEASLLRPFHPQVPYQQAIILELRGNLLGAFASYKEALCCDVK